MIVAFDLDGTLIDSENAKLTAFASLFVGLPDYEDIVLYNRRNRGVPRKEKFIHICSNIIKVNDVDTEVSLLVERYANKLSECLFHCPPISGICGFLRSMEAPKAVVSSAPKHEIESCLERLGILDCFNYIYGNDHSKESALSKLASIDKSLVYFGDAKADWQAALSVGCAFIRVRSVVCPEQFRGYNGAEIDNYENYDAVSALLRC
ncbi:MAG: HAD hydrolase-like protein [Marinomonas sp.]